MVFYFYGENSFAIKERIDAIKQQYIKKTGGDADMQTLDMSEHTLSDLLNSLGVLPMFVSSRLIIVKELSNLKLSKDQVNKLIDAVADSTTLIIVDTVIDKRSAYFKTLSTIKNAKHFHLLTPPQIVAWVKSIVNKLGSEIDNTATAYLIEKVGVDQWQLIQELKKLSNYQEVITKETIDELVVPNLHQTAFMMIDAILQGNAILANELYERLKIAGEPDQMILGAIVYQYRLLVLCKDNEGKNNAWTKEFGLSPYAVSKAQNIVRKLDMKDLKRAYQAIVETDMSIKTGQSDPTGAMQQLIINLTQT